MDDSKEGRETGLLFDLDLRNEEGRLTQTFQEEESCTSRVRYF
jgi:hypothetical protein